MSRGSASIRRLRQLEDLLRAGTARDLSDGELLDWFARSRDDASEAAFAALVERHGPMVFRVCRQSLDDPHAAEDAVQATFLVLARQAGAIRKRPSVSSWLFGVARRAAARIRMEEARRRRYESRSEERSSARLAARQEPPDPDPYPELHAEIERLPENYRLPIVLCYFEGLTHEQAASRLRWPLGTLKTRLSRARDRLRSRLERRGRPFLIPLPADLLRPGSPGTLPEHLVRAATQVGRRYAASGPSVTVLSSAVPEVAREIMISMFMNKLKSAAIVLSGLVLVGLGAAVVARQATSQGRAVPPRASIEGNEDAASVLRLQGVTDYDPASVLAVQAPFDARVDKVLVDLGSAVKKGDPLIELFSTDLAAAKGDYEVAVGQWKHDKKIYDYKMPLARSNTLAGKEAIEVESDEAQSRLKMRLAKDKLLFYGLTEQEIEAAKNEDGVQRAKFTLRARADGVVIKREAVVGNYYASRDTLLTLVQPVALWIRARVHEQESPRIKIGQDLTVIFPFADQRGVRARVEYIDPRVDPETRTVMFRTSIPNPDLRYKAGAFVRVELEAQPRRDALERHRGSGEQSLDPAAMGRLTALERKVDRLLGESEERATNTRILERLDALERKIDRLLDARRRESP